MEKSAEKRHCHDTTAPRDIEHNRNKFKKRPITNATAVSSASALTYIRNPWTLDMPLLGSMAHVSITVSNLTRAMEFFRPFLDFLGYEIWDEIKDRNGQRLHVTVNNGNGAVLNIWEAKPEYAKHRFEVYEVGLHHIAFNTDTREQVERAHELVKKLGGQILDGPAEFPYDPEGWYAVYFTGPDGLKFEVVHQPSTVRRYGELMRMAENAMQR